MKRRFPFPGLFMGITAALLALGLVFAQPAQAADSFTFAGRGNGHGMGMSQWGAWQAAREGNTYQQILAFYYPGATLALTVAPGVADPLIQVRLSATPWTSSTTVFSDVILRPVAAVAWLYMDGVPKGSVPVRAAVTLDNTAGKVRVTVNGEDRGSCNYMELQPGTDGDTEGRVQITLTEPGASSSTEPREYWGILRVQHGDSVGQLWVYNRVPLEKYVRSIAEVDYDWAVETSPYYALDAVKAQAIAARTYAVAKGGATITDGWADQCYRGYSFEATHQGIAKAAADTAGQILVYDGKPISAYFSGHSGGYTSNSAWAGAKPPYIVAQPDPWSLKAPPKGVGGGPGSSWTYTISAEALSNKVNGKLKDISGAVLRIGRISDVQIIYRDTVDLGSHARTLRFTGSDGSTEVSVASLRNLVGSSNLPSTLILSVNDDPGAGEPGDWGNGGLMPGEFYDVGAGHLYHDEITRVVTAELMGGYEDGMFKPEGTVSRAQFAKIAVSLYNTMHVGDPILVLNVAVKPFDDVVVDSAITGDSSDWIAAAKKAGLVGGVTAGVFSPYDEIQRDQMATMMCRALGWEDEAAALPDEAPGFADVLPGNPHWAAAVYLKQQGILLGYASTNASLTALGAAEPIKRQHVAVILCRVLDLQLGLP